MANKKNKSSALVCLSISATDGPGILRALEPAQDLVDLVEIRLDAMIDPQPEAWMARIPLPVLATNRPVWEGGFFAGPERERIGLLCRAMRAGAQYADLELAAEQRLRAELLAIAESCAAKIILSHHDFRATPDASTLKQILRQMMDAPGIHAGKIVTTAACATDTLRLLDLQRIALAAAFPLSTFAMGPTGRISRLAGLHLGGYMTYVCPDAKNATAPGQLSAQELVELQTILLGFY